MKALLNFLFRYFRDHRVVFWITFVSTLAVLGVGAYSVEIEEDITRFFPRDERVEKLNYVFENSKFTERLVMMVSVADTATAPDPDKLVECAEAFIDSIRTNTSDHISSVTAQVDDSRMFELVGAIQANLPIYLEESDYAKLDSLTKESEIRRRLENSFRQLVSPSGIVTKNIIAKDPVGITYLVLEKLQRLQYDDHIELYDGYLMSKDQRHLIFFVSPKHKPNETGKIAPLIAKLDLITAQVNAMHPDLKVSYFGAAAVAVGNAKQLQRDSILTISVTVILIVVFLLGFFRRKRIPILIFVPVVFGALFSLTMVSLIQGTISVIAIAAGSIILGIAVNYSLHFLTHLRHVQKVEQVINDLVKPMTIGSATTVLAFFCLRFVNAAVLQDLGLFAGFSLIGAAICSLVFLPQLISVRLFGGEQRANWLDTFASRRFRSGRYVLIGIAVVTPVLFYFASDVKFNTDLSQLNFMTDNLREAQQRLESINRSSLSSIYVVSQSDTHEHALQMHEAAVGKLRALQRKSQVQKMTSVADFYLSDSLQELRLRRWNQYWTQERRENLLRAVRTEGAKLKFAPVVFQNFDSLINRRYQRVDQATQQTFRNAFYDDFIIEKDGSTTIIALANVSPENKAKVYDQLDDQQIAAFDRQMIANLFVEYVHADFNFIVTFTGALVFIALLITYGRIELTLITFVPMLITWVWILGLMALLGIEFNIVNVMISTFIFGLGDDYSIFTMDGLQQEYQFKKPHLESVRISILLSALTTISGLGVLIFAEHPALRSIAAISIIGIVSVFVMSQTIQPFLFQWLITSRTERGLAPMTLFGLLKTIFTYGFFIFGSFSLTIIGLVLKLIPGLSNMKRLWFHVMIRLFTRSLLMLAPQLKLTFINKNPDVFRRSSVIIANHASFLDILIMTSLHPKLILLTNKWVWNSPVFGGVVRLAEYYPVMEGAEDSVRQVQERVKEGYSVVVFPEGTRSPDGTIARFHKGAFFMAQQLNIPITPVIIHGAHHAIPKSTIYLNQGELTIKFLPLIEPGDAHFGQTYQERTKAISRYFREEYRKLALENETPRYLRHRLEQNYLYKGPVLEWYMRIKIRLEDYYAPFHKLVPMQGDVLDLGCGYGFLPLMLSFLSHERRIHGVDYDEEKIETARHSFSMSARLSFSTADITNLAFQQEYDCIIIADVLHYLRPPDQELVVAKSISALRPGGKLIIREGNSELRERHKGTKLTELFSVKILKFNKSVNDLHFLSETKVRTIAEKLGHEVQVLDDTKLTSNVIFVVSKR